jgi:hypothetical protein
MKIDELDKKRYQDAQKFGRIDQEGRVFLRSENGEKFVGQYPAGEIDKTMNLYVQRFVAFEAELDLFEKRIQAEINMTAPQIDNAINIFKSFVALRNAIGNYEQLNKRVQAISEQGEKQKLINREKRQEQIAESLRKLNQIVNSAQSLIADDFEKINWSKASNAFEEYFTEWKNIRSFINLPEKQINELWARFSSTRDIIRKERRERDIQRRENAKRVKFRKKAIIEEANKIKESTNFDATKRTFNRLMDEWKKVGRGIKKDDDLQWEQFNNARQYFYDRIPQKELPKKEDAPKWKNDFSSLGTSLSGLESLAQLAKQLKEDSK